METMGESHVGHNWMDEDCVNQNREHKVSRERRELCGWVLYIPSIGCIRDFSLVISDKNLGAQRGQESGCSSERLTKHFLLLYEKNDLGLTFYLCLPGNLTEVNASCVTRQHCLWQE